MKAKATQPRRPSALLAAALLIASPATYAQSAATSSGSATPSPEEEVVKLSPFQVDASKDIGYYAENTLVGSRLNTNVADLAASITVVTKQQLIDTGALDINDVFMYESNTEGANTYTPYIFNRSLVRDGISGYSGDDGSSFGIATANRVRGLGVADTAQNNYPTISRLAFDAYNTNSVEINRGPNSLLFGTGSPAGIVNQSSSEAVLGRRHATVSARFGSFGAYRFTLDANVPLSDKVAIYVAGLYDSRGFQRKPSSDIYRRRYAAITIKPTSKTKLTASYEHYSNFNNRPNYISPSDLVSPWIQAGKPSWNPTTQLITFADGSVKGPYLQSTLDKRWVAGLPSADGNLTDTTSVFYVPGLQLLTNRATLVIDQGNIIYFPAATAQFGGAAPGLPAVTSRNAAGWTVAQWIASATRYAQSRAYIAPLPPQSVFAATGATNYGRWTEVSVTDQSIYDWEEYNVQGGNYGRQRAQVFNIELQQEILPNLNLSVGWFRQEFQELTHYGLGQANQAARLYVDPNTNLLDGTPNSYYGSPYVLDSQLDTFYVPESNNSVRAMVAYELNLTDKDNWLRHLGRHRFLGLGSKQKTWKNNLRYRLSFDGGDARFLPSAANLAATGNSRNSFAANAANVQRIFYLGHNKDTVVDRGVANLASAGYGGPESASLTYYDWNSAPQAIRTTTMPFHQNLFYAGANYGVFKRNLDSASGSWQGYLWKNRIIPTVGWRRDKLMIQTYNGRKADGTLLTNEDLVSNGFAQPNFWNNLGAPFRISGNTTTKGVVVRPFKDWAGIESSASSGSFVAGLLKNLSFHYNESDNFNAPPAIQVDFYDQVLGKPSGTGKDYGIGVNLFDDKLVLNLNWYESNNKNVPASAARNAIDRTVRIDTTSARRWAEYVVRIKHGQDPRTDLNFHNNTINPLSQQEQDEIAAIVELPYTWPATYQGAINGTETDISKGLEFQMVYNPKRNWNIKLTVGQQKATVSDSVGELLTWLAVRKPFWEGLRSINFVPGGTINGIDVTQPMTRANGNRLDLSNFWNGYGFTQDAAFNDAPSGPAGGTGSPAVTFAQIVEPDLFSLTSTKGTKVANLREWSCSLITNYAFQGERLKGFSIGGSFRWADSATAGYMGLLDPATYSHPAGSPGPAYPAGTPIANIVFPDLDRPIMTPSEAHLDLWASYTRKIFRDKVRMRIQLNLRDVNNAGGLQPVSFNLDGSPAQYRILDPRTWFVTTTFDF